MKQVSLIIFAFVFEGLALWSIGENTSLRTRYDRFMKYPVKEKSAALKSTGNMLADNTEVEYYDLTAHIHKLVK